MIKIQYNHPTQSGVFVDVSLEASVMSPAVQQTLALIQLLEQEVQAPVAPVATSCVTPDEPIREETPTIRKRLPNRTDVIDPSQLEVDVNGSRLYNNFRCPNCGQSSVIWSDGVPVVRDIINNDKCYEVTPYISVTSAEDFTYERACELSGDQVSIVCNEDTVCKCPRCGHANQTQEFVDAYHYPHKYFEAERLCPLCGDEVCMSIDSTNNEACWKCENETCHFELPA